MPLQLTIVVATRCGENSLRRTLTSLVALEIPAALDVEVLLVPDRPGGDLGRVQADFSAAITFAEVAETPAPSARTAVYLAAQGRGD